MKFFSVIQLFSTMIAPPLVVVSLVVIGTLCLFEIHGIKQEGRGSMFVLFLSVTLKHPELQSISITHNTLCSCPKTAVYLFESQRINFPFGGRASMC